MAKCKETVFSDFSRHQCWNNAKRDGYCGVHHPDAVAARKAKQEAKWADEQARWQAKQDAEALRERKAAAFDALLEAVEKVLDFHQVTHCHAAARAALEAAKKATEGE